MKKKNQLGKGFWESPGVKLVLAIAIPVIAILILIMIYMIMKPETMVESRLVIDNFGELLPEVPAETEHRIEERLYEVMSCYVYCYGCYESQKRSLQFLWVLCLLPSS